MDELLIPNQQSKPRSKWRVPIIIASVILIIVIGFGVATAVLAHKYENKIYPGVRVGNIMLGGLTKEAAKDLLDQKIKIYDAGFNFSTDNTQRNISGDGIVTFNTENMATDAFQIGRQGNIWDKSWPLFVYSIAQLNFTPDFQLDKTLLKSTLQSSFSPAENPGQNSDIVFTTDLPAQAGNSTASGYSVSFSDSMVGLTFDYDKAIADLNANISVLQNPLIQLNKQIAYPTITKDKSETQRANVEKLLALKNITLNYNDKSWPIAWNNYSNWLTIGLNDDNQPSVQLNQDAVNNKLIAISQEIDQPALDAKLQVKDGKVTEFQGSQNGIALDMAKSFKNISDALINDNEPKIDLVVNVTEPKIRVAAVNELGIKEKIGIGTSNFANSPSNRRHNIGIGAAALNGIILKPDEEFSLVKTLGEIDDEHGYLPELVIKGGATIPEFGGGLCQVGTTIFRAALATGLPITARTNHSYQVVYYAPTGTDATIYSPLPDFKFINDTGNTILIQAKMSGDNLSFELWGTSDGRTVSFEGKNTTTDLTKLQPTVYNVTVPGPAREVETTNLAPGVRKLSGTAHNGADALFYRYVTKLGAPAVKETWKSHYVPWRAVYLVGVDPNKVIPVESNNSTTPVSSNSTLPATN